MPEKLIRIFCLLLVALTIHSSVHAQCTMPDTLNWGPNDTVLTSAICYEGELIPYKESEMAWVSNMTEKQLEKYKREYNRLRNAVYVTYPFARTAGVTLNEIQLQLTQINSKKEKNKYLKSREKELKDQFADPLTNLSVYQGRVLMKLINRQTGNNCYSIIREYKGGVSARLYQTVAFFFGSSLKQDYDMKNATDRQIETIVKEIDGMWYNSLARPMSSVN